MPSGRGPPPQARGPPPGGSSGGSSKAPPAHSGAIGVPKGRGCKPPPPPAKGPRGKKDFKAEAEAIKEELDPWGCPIKKEAPKPKPAAPMGRGPRGPPPGGNSNSGGGGGGGGGAPAIHAGMSLAE